MLLRNIKVAFNTIAVKNYLEILEDKLLLHSQKKYFQATSHDSGRCVRECHTIIDGCVILLSFFYHINFIISSKQRLTIVDIAYKKAKSFSENYLKVTLNRIPVEFPLAKQLL